MPNATLSTNRPPAETRVEIPKFLKGQGTGTSFAASVASEYGKFYTYILKNSWNKLILGSQRIQTKYATSEKQVYTRVQISIIH